MDIIFNRYLWLLPILAFLGVYSSSKKRLYVAEHNLKELPSNYDIADDYRTTLFFAVIAFLPFVFISANRTFGFGDTAAYANMFWSWPDSIFAVDLSGDERYPGFIYFTAFVKQFITKDFRTWFFIIAAIQCFCLSVTYRRYTSEVVFCAYLFLMCDFQGWMNNGIRQFLVATIMFALTPLILSEKKSKWLIFLAVGLLLYYTHVSVIIALPIYFIALGKPMNKKTMAIIILIVFAIVFVDQFTGLLSDTLEGTNYETSTSELTSTANGTNLLRVLFFSIPSALVIIFRKKIPDDLPQIISYSINMSLVGTAFYFLSAFTNGISIGRMPIYFTLYNYILLPWEIKTFFKLESRQIIFNITIIVYFIFYSFQMSTWGL